MNAWEVNFFRNFWLLIKSPFLCVPGHVFIIEGFGFHLLGKLCFFSSIIAGIYEQFSKKIIIFNFVILFITRFYLDGWLDVHR